MIFRILDTLDGIFWSYAAFVLIMCFGAVFSYKIRFAQLTEFPKFCRIFYNSFKTRSAAIERGVHPIRLFFASAGGNIGIGNVVGIATAVCCGGPGAIFWVWIAGIIGSVIKYAEVFLGIKFREKSQDGSYKGGPMYFLKKAYGNSWIPGIVASLLCIYGVEIYQFSVITNTISSNWNIPRIGVIGVLLFLVFYAIKGGLKRLGKVCTIILPIFMVSYCLMGLAILIFEWRSLPQLFSLIFSSAFTGHAAVGGFIGCSVMTTLRHGISRAAYSGDIGIGFDSVIQSESADCRPEVQARFSIVGIAIDNLICTVSLIIVLASGAWHGNFEGNTAIAIQSALSKYFPGINFFFPLFLFVTGYTTITAYFLVGQRCAQYLYPSFGKKIYFIYGMIALPAFCFLSQDKTLIIMSCSGALLLIINLIGIFILRKEVAFPKVSPEELRESNPVFDLEKL
ncbi:MAG: amino acid carrier protein [Victivallaceae bacterium]